MDTTTRLRRTICGCGVDRLDVTHIPYIECSTAKACRIDRTVIEYALMNKQKD
jgi:hypothetical protein